MAEEGLPRLLVGFGLEAESISTSIGEDCVDRDTGRSCVKTVREEHDESAIIFGTWRAPLATMLLVRASFSVEDAVKRLKVCVPRGEVRALGRVFTLACLALSFRPL
jgi:hypothetical protein